MKTDFLIVGLGLAGGVVSEILSNRNKSVYVIDDFNPDSSSLVAAGLVNPVTGRRVVKSWMADELLPFAKKFYRSIEEKSDRFFFHEMDVLEIVHSVKEVNDWTSRMAEPELSSYLNPVVPDIYADKISGYKKIFRITSSGWMNIPAFIEIRRNELARKNLILNQKFEYSDLIISNDSIQYKDISASAIIFCEGVKTTQNPLWQHLPFLPAKGEILTIHCELPEDFILMSGMFIIPVGDSKFRVGATYEWNYTDENISEKGKSKLISQLDEFLKVPYEIVDHRAGIRPTVKDRRPIIGKHPLHDNVFIFNGLGTKGVQLAPFFANHFIDHLLNHTTLIAEVNAERFPKMVGPLL
jgi:glycine oxidase